MELLRPILARVNELSFEACSKSRSGWSGNGQGQVEVEETPEALIFRESGTWQSPQGRHFPFHNVYRWTFDAEGASLEHLRFGADKPVFLFKLVPRGLRFWSSDCGHQCSLDLYTATLKIHDDHLALDWKVAGPEMDEDIRYIYRTRE